MKHKFHLFFHKRNIIFESLHETREQFHTFLMENNKELTRKNFREF